MSLEYHDKYKKTIGIIYLNYQKKIVQLDSKIGKRNDKIITNLQEKKENPVEKKRGICLNRSYIKGESYRNRRKT